VEGFFPLAGKSIETTAMGKRLEVLKLFDSVPSREEY
jgi:hypothetical protein